MPVDALNEMGISMQSAGGQKHPGINAAVAIEAIDDIEDEHWVPFGRNAENWSMSVAKLMIRSASTIATRHGEYSIQVKMRDDSLIRIAWADVSMNDFQIRVFPSSVLPQQPSNRLQKLQTLFDAGIIDRQTFLQQLGAPDQLPHLFIRPCWSLGIFRRQGRVVHFSNASIRCDCQSEIRPPAALLGSTR